MAHCKKCGRELRPGEGHEPMVFNWKDPSGLICDQCSEMEGAGIALVVKFIVYAVKFFVYGLLGMAGSFPVLLPISLLMNRFIQDDCPQACEIIFPICKGIVLAYAIAAIILFVVCRIYAKFRLKRGWFVRMLVKIIGFAALCTGLVSGYLAIFDEAYLRELWKIDKTESVNNANAEGVTNGVESVSIDAEVRDVAPVTANEAAQ